MRGYYGIGIWQPMHECNIGTLFRSAYAMDASYIFTIGRKYRKQSSDTCNATAHVPYFNYQSTDEFLSNIPRLGHLVCVEITDKARPLQNFVHPAQAIYLLGSEGQTLPEKLLSKGLQVKIPSKICLNVATAGSILLYDRIAKCAKIGN